MDEDWKPSWNPAVDLQALPLEPDDAFVLTRLDGHTRVADLPSMTGLPQEKLTRVLHKLVSCGAVTPPRSPAAPAMTVGAPQGVKASAPVSSPPVRATEPEPSTGDAPLPGNDTADAPDASEASEPEDATGTHRQLFASQLHDLSPDERAHRAATAVEPYLSAFCYDPVPAVIKAVLSNPGVGLVHARLIAQHHRNPAGLEVVASRGAFAMDGPVRRWLVRNPQLPASVFNRLFGSRRLLELFQLTVSREVPEQTRRLCREALRRRFVQAVAEERVEVILKTEGRVLANLIGLPIDGRTTAQLCGRPYGSTTLIQNIARWSAAPPPLIAHLLRQEMVRRSPSLRMMLQRHPNAPSERG